MPLRQLLTDWMTMRMKLIFLMKLTGPLVQFVPPPVDLVLRLLAKASKSCQGQRCLGDYMNGLDPSQMEIQVECRLQVPPELPLAKVGLQE